MKLVDEFDEKEITMKILFLLLFCLCFFSEKLYSQSQIDTLAIINKLKNLYERDQKTRKGIDSVAFIQFIDSTNQVQICEIINKYGWLGKSVVGKYNSVLFLVIQHADLKTQEKYYPLLKNSVEIGESSASEAALMEDRILMRQGKKQKYGSQIIINENGVQVLYPIEDERNVNIRRSKVGLESIEEYVNHFGIDYKLNLEK